MTDKGPRILHIDDDPMMLRLSETVLGASGFRVHTTQDPKEVVASVDGRYDMYLIDLLMPETDGLTLCRQLRETGWDGPILVLSNKTLSPDERRKLREWDADHMVKLFGPQDLIRRVQECLTEEKWSENKQQP